MLFVATFLDPATQPWHSSEEKAEVMDEHPAELGTFAVNVQGQAGAS